jgi:hypothetical protein
MGEEVAAATAIDAHDDGFGFEHAPSVAA